MIRKISIIVLFVLFTLSVVLCRNFGEEIRGALATEIQCVPISYYVDEDGISRPTVPEEAVYSDDDGAYLLILEESDDYAGEGIFVLKSVHIAESSREDGMVRFRFLTNTFLGKVACDPEKEFGAGDIVRIMREE